MRPAVGEELGAVGHRDELAELDDLDAGEGLGTAGHLSSLADANPSYIDGVPGSAPSPSVLPSPSVRPPIARRDPRIDIVHGDRREDDYFWLRRKEDPEVSAYLEAENAYTDAVMKPTEAFQARLYDEMLARIKEDDTSFPYRRGGHFYYARTEPGNQYPIHSARPGTPE